MQRTSDIRAPDFGIDTECRRQIVNLENRLDDLRIKHGERRDQQVAARRNDQTRQRLAALPVDTRPPPSVDAYDQLLTRRPRH